MEHKKNEKPEPEFHSVGYVAAVLGLCPRTVYRACNAGKIKVIRCGASVLIPTSEVRRVAEKGF
ncbi:MAG: helix-turn-helix domain-containing protein [Terriglobales bacterium]